jgi:rhomboid protease GluP
VQNPGEKARVCPRCGALNGAGFDRCIRCAGPLQALAAGSDALKGSVDARQLWGTKIIVGLTILVFAGQLAAMKSVGFQALLAGGSRADMLRFGAMPISFEDVQAEPFRLLSAMFVHFGVLHAGMNLMSLVNVGRVAEPGIGSARFVVAYLVSGALGFALNLAIEAVFPHPGPVPVITAGASGAVFGAMGLVLGWLIRMRDRRWRGFAVQAVFFAVVLVFLKIPVNVGAHLGGLAVGAAFGFYYAGNPRPKSLLLANVGAIVGLVLSIASLLLAQRSAGWGKRPFPARTSIEAPSERAGAALDALDAPAGSKRLKPRSA